SEPGGDDSDIISAIEDYITGKSGGAATTATVETPPQAEEAEEPAPVPAEPVIAAKPPAAAIAATDAGAETKGPEKGPEYLRVQMSVLEDLINMVSELVLTRNQLLQLVRVEGNAGMAAPFQRL